MTKNVFDNHSPLRFDAEGKFRILILSDLQESPAYDRRSLLAMHALIEECKPDLVLLGGDNLVDCHSAQEYKALLDVFAAPMEERCVHWTQVFGNHDVECNAPLSKKELALMYKSYPHNVSASDVDSFGECTHLIPIFGKDNTPAFAIYAIDSGDYLSYGAHLYRQNMLPDHFVNTTNYAVMDFENVMWYYNTSKSLEKRWGRKIPALMFFHICPHEIDLIARNPQETAMIGEQNEKTCPGVFNSGIFAAVMQRGDVKGIYCGHDHVNTYEGSYFGVRLGFCSNIGYSTYGLPGSDSERNRLRGGRLITVSEESPGDFTSQIIFAKDHLR